MFAKGEFEGILCPLKEDKKWEARNLGLVVLSHFRKESKNLSQVVGFLKASLILLMQDKMEKITLIIMRMAYAVKPMRT